MRQARIDSFMEALVNVVIGFAINFVANVIVIPLVLNVPVNVAALGFIGAIYTVLSVVRSYVIRRVFDGRSPWQALKERLRPEARTHRERAERARRAVEALVKQSGG